MKTIPKIIHYVWVGGNEKSELAKHCIASWQKYCPDYQIIEWNEKNFKIEENSQVHQAIKEKNWAYASDIIRVWALKTYGGIYLDTDVELIKNLDELLLNEVFLCYESKYWFGSAVIGAIKNHPMIELIWQRYQHKEPIKFNTNALTVHAFMSAVKFLYQFKPNGKTQKTNQVLALSSDYFYPIDYMTLKERKTANTVGIHYYGGSWHTDQQKRGFNFAKTSRKILGKHLFSFFEKMVANHYHRMLKKEYKKLKGESK